jgi:hypothetical protein
MVKTGVTHLDVPGLAATDLDAGPGEQAGDEIPGRIAHRFKPGAKPLGLRRWYSRTEF